MNIYTYEGPVLEYGYCVDAHWKGATRAVSDRKARCNLAWQFKRKRGIGMYSVITFPGDLIGRELPPSLSRIKH